MLTTLKSSEGTEFCWERKTNTESLTALSQTFGGQFPPAFSQCRVKLAQRHLGFSLWCCLSFLHVGNVSTPHLRSKHFNAEYLCVLCLYQCTFLETGGLFLPHKCSIYSIAAIPDLVKFRHECHPVVKFCSWLKLFWQPASKGKIHVSPLPVLVRKFLFIILLLWSSKNTNHQYSIHAREICGDVGVDHSHI